MVGKRWEVVGGGEKGGILVREGRDLQSPKLDECLATGAVVEEVAVEGERLSFRKLTGAGPPQGWVSLRLKDKPLLVPHQPSEAEAEPEAEAEEGEPAAGGGLAPGTFSGEGRTLGSADSTSAPAAETPQERRLRALEAAQRRQATIPGVSEEKRAQLLEAQAKEELVRKLTEHYARTGEDLPLGLRAASAEQLRKHWEGLAREDFKPPPRGSGGGRAFSSRLARSAPEDQARRAEGEAAHGAEEQRRRREEEEEQRRQREEEEERQRRQEKELERRRLEEQRRREREDEERRRREPGPQTRHDLGESGFNNQEEDQSRRSEALPRAGGGATLPQAPRVERATLPQESRRKTPRSKLMCATPGCHMAVHSRPELGGYCCIACSESNGMEHGPRCEQVLAPADAVKADRTWVTMGGDQLEDLELEEALHLSMIDAAGREAAFLPAAAAQPARAGGMGGGGAKSGKSQEELDLEEAMRLSMLDAAPQDSPELDDEARELEEAIRLSQMMDNPEEPPEDKEDGEAGQEGDGGGETSDDDDDDDDEVPDLVPIEQK